MSHTSQIDLSQAEAFNAIAWIMKNNIVNENNSEIEFDDHAFLIDPYMDTAERQTIKKCSQIGWSTLAILRSFHLARFAGANIIHTFPSRNIAKDFVVPKVNTLIANNPIIKKMIGVDSLYLKQVGDRFIYYRGTYEQTEAISISAHILINDEYDRSNPKVLKTYRSRLDDAKRERPELGWEWRFSNPSIPGFGVDELWEKSDQKHWFVKCRKCGHDWYLRFPDSINFETEEKICEKCGNPYTRQDLIDGRWVRKYLNRSISGYWISQLFVPWIPAKKIIEDSEGDQDVFHNFTLGQPYVSKDTAVRREAILRCLIPGSNPQTNVAIGVDNGVSKHYVVGNRLGIFRVGETTDWGEIESLRNQYGATMVIDALPYQTMPMKLSAKYPGKVFIHYYQMDKKGAGTIRWDFNDGVVRSDRTKIIDSVVAEINSQDIIFNLTATDLQDYIYHWEQMYRILKETTLGVKRPHWETIEDRPDHYAHATILWRVAMERTLTHGGIVNVPSPGYKEKHPIVSADGTVPALDIKKSARRSGKKKVSWKTI